MSDHRRRDWLRCHQPDWGWVSPFAPASYDFGTGLYYASFLGMESVVQEMFRRGADVNAQGGYYGFPLQAVAVTGNLMVMQMLINKGAEMNARGGVFGNALMAATHKGHAETVKLLLDHGADLTVDHNNMTALHLVGYTENTEIADAILASGVSVDLAITRKFWETRKTTQGNDTQRRRIWICEEDPGIPVVAPLSKRGLTPLHYAALVGSLAMTKYFIDHGADPNAKSDNGETPLHLAVKQRQYEPEWPGIKDDWNDPYRNFHTAVEFQLDIDHAKMRAKYVEMRNEIVEALVCHEKIDLDAKDYLGRGALHCAALRRSESTDILSRLLRRCTTIDARDVGGRTALHVACAAGNAKAVSLLIAHGADLLAEGHSGYISIHFAAQSADLETLQTILQAAKNLDQNIVDSRDAQGANAMHHLIYFLSDGHVGGHVALDTIKCLADNGVAVNALSHDGSPPIAFYLMRIVPWSEKAIVVAHLLSLGADALYRSSADGRNLAHLAASHSDDIRTELLKPLERHGVRLKDKDNYGRTILHHCARNGSLMTEAAATFLCDHVGLSPVEPDESGETPLSIAIAEDARPRDPQSYEVYRYQQTMRLLAAHAHARSSSSPQGSVDPEDFVGV